MWDGDRRLWNAVVRVPQGFHSCPRVSIAVPVWRNEGLGGILWPLGTILVSWPLTQAVRPRSPRQVTHDGIVLWMQKHTDRGYILCM